MSPRLKPQPVELEPLISEERAIELLGLQDTPNPHGALRWQIRMRRLKAVRIGRHLSFRPEDLKAFIDSRVVE